MTALLDVGPVGAVALLSFYLPVLVVSLKTATGRLPSMVDFYPRRSAPAQRLLDARKAAARQQAHEARIKGGLTSTQTPSLEMDWFTDDTPRRTDIH